MANIVAKMQHTHRRREDDTYRDSKFGTHTLARFTVHKLKLMTICKMLISCILPLSVIHLRLQFHRSCHQGRVRFRFLTVQLSVYLYLYMRCGQFFFRTRRGWKAFSSVHSSLSITSRSGVPTVRLFWGRELPTRNGFQSCLCWVFNEYWFIGALQN